VDINKIYRSLFSVKGIVEAVFTAGDGRGSFDRQEVSRNSGVALGCENTIDLDAFTTVLAGYDPRTVDYLRLAAQHFGGWDPQVYTTAKQTGIRIF
jgi:uncharacterized protein (DUF362 family)